MASPTNSADAMTSAATTPVSRVAAPNSLLRSDAGTIMLAAVPPPRPATTLASPVARNSRSPVQVLVRGHLEPGEIHDHDNERDHYQHQHGG